MSFLAMLFISAVAVVAWLRAGRFFPRVALSFLWLVPFVPVVSLLNHNLDGDAYAHWVRVTPFWVMIVLLTVSAISFYRTRPLRMGWEGVWLVLYIGLVASQIPQAADARWAVFAMSWSAPGYLLCLLAGQQISLRDIAADWRGVAAVLAFLTINLALIFYGMATGRAESIINTRNFGSIYASNSLLLFLSLYMGLAWLRGQRSVWQSYALFAGSLVAMALSISKTVFMLIPLFLSFFITRSGRGMQLLVLAGLGGLTAFIGLELLSQSEGFEQDFYGSWLGRLADGRPLVAIDNAVEARSDEFSGYWEAVRSSNPFVGHGYGNFDRFSAYRDAHNLFVTESFENSLVGAMVLFLAFGLPRLMRLMWRREVRPVAASVLIFLVLAHTTGGVLSTRGVDQYYATHTGWSLFFLVGLLANAERAARRQRRAAAPGSLRSS